VAGGLCDSACPDTCAAMTRGGFDSALKEALRCGVRPDLLARNALLSTRLLSRSDARASTPQALRTLIIESAKSLFANERDQKLYRALELTYFNPAPKQVVVAERLGCSFSTYRRHLTASVDRLTEWLWQQEQEFWQAEAVNDLPPDSSTPLSDPALPAARPRLSLAILPFLNISQEKNVEYLVDGIVDVLITDLSSCLPDSFVISRSTAFTYKGRSVPVRQVGTELGVRYVLEGSVLVNADRIRVNVQLIDTETDQHLWAERFDKERKEVLQVQDEIVGRISRSVGIQLIRTEAGRGNHPGDVFDLVLRARGLISDLKRKDTAVKAIELFRQALQLDPHCVNAMVGIALTRIYQVIDLHLIRGRDALLGEAEKMISRAAEDAPDHLDVLKTRALLLRARGRFTEAVIANEALIVRNPAEPIAYKEMGLNKLYLGDTREAAEWFRRADGIAPRDPARWLQGLGRALIHLGRRCWGGRCPVSGDRQQSRLFSWKGLDCGRRGAGR
jgi:TolB-like protein